MLEFGSLDYKHGFISLAYRCDTCQTLCYEMETDNQEITFICHNCGCQYVLPWTFQKKGEEYASYRLRQAVKSD